MCVTSDTIWYHGSPYEIDTLLPGSTVTPWRALAEAFSHKPPMLAIDDDGTITHNGAAFGYLYRIAEPVAPDRDVVAHPRSSMGENLEFLTTRPLRLALIASTGAPTADEMARAQAILARYRAGKA